MKIMSLYAPNIRTPSFIKQTLWDLKEEICFNAVIVRNFKIPHPSMYRSPIPNSIKETSYLKYSLDQIYPYEQKLWEKSYQWVEHFDTLNHILHILLLQCSKTEIQKK